MYLWVSPVCFMHAGFNPDVVETLPFDFAEPPQEPVQSNSPAHDDELLKKRTLVLGETSPGSEGPVLDEEPPTIPAVPAASAGGLEITESDSDVIVEVKGGDVGAPATLDPEHLEKDSEPLGDEKEPDDHGDEKEPDAPTGGDSKEGEDHDDENGAFNPMEFQDMALQKFQNCKVCSSGTPIP